MIKTRLIGLVPDSQKFIAANVIAQWLGLCANVLMIFTIAKLLDNLRMGQAVSAAESGSIIAIAVIVRVLCVKLAASASYHASRSVKRTLRGMIYEKLLRLGTAYTEHVPTGEVVQLAGEGVEQLETYFGAYLPQFFYALLAPLTLFIIVSRISMKVAVVLLVCVPLIPVSIVIVQKIAKRLLNKYWGQYAVLGDNFLENLQGLTTLKIYQADKARHQEMNKDGAFPSTKHLTITESGKCQSRLSKALHSTSLCRKAEWDWTWAAEAVRSLSHVQKGIQGGAWWASTDGERNMPPSVSPCAHKMPRQRA